MITELEFKSLAAQGYNRIPLLTEAFADLETPLSLYLKLAYGNGGGKHSFLLESVVGGERFGRYSFIGLPARTLLRATGFRTEVLTDGVVVETHEGNPLDFIDAYQKRFKAALRPGLPRFCGGLAGYFGYDAVRYIEKKLENTCPPDTLGTPDILLLQCEELAVIDPSAAVIVDVQNTLVINALLRWASEDQKQHFLPRLATNTVGAYALSEAGSGSDAFALVTRASADGEAYVLNGQKLWITNAAEAGLFLVFATVNAAAGYKGITCFVVDRDTPGFRIGKKEDKLGIRASSTCELIFEDCRVPKQNILGEVGKDEVGSGAADADEGFVDDFGLVEPAGERPGFEVARVGRAGDSAEQLADLGEQLALLRIGGLNQAHDIQRASELGRPLHVEPALRVKHHRLEVALEGVAAVVAARLEAAVGQPVRTHRACPLAARRFDQLDFALDVGGDARVYGLVG